MTAAKQMVDMRFLRTLVPLGELDQAQMQRLMGHYTVELVEAGNVLFSIGETDAYTYYVLSGQVQLHFRSGSEREVKAQTTQARYMLVPERPRTATAKALTTCTILKIEKDVLDELVRWGDRKGINVDSIEDESKESDWMSHYLRSKVFLKLRAQNIQALMMKLEEIPVRAGQVIIRQDDDDGYYYIIKKGHCQVTRHDPLKNEDVELAVLTVGTGFGEEAIITHNRRGATVTMLDDGALMRISREDFRHLLVQPLIEDINYKQALALGNQVFLDVRPYDDYMRDGIRNAENIALMQIRPRLEEFSSDKIYVTYSNDGYAASAAAFLLCQQGINAIVLRGGMHGLPGDVERGNQPDDDIPVVDNVINLKSSNVDSEEYELPDDEYDYDEVMANPKLQSLLLPEKDAQTQPPQPTSQFQQPTEQALDTDRVMQNPEVAALFDDARHRAEAHSGIAEEAGEASRVAQEEVERLKREAEAAKRELDKARKAAELEVKHSAEKARQIASQEAARLRELELGAKQAEMEEAIRQAEEEGARAKKAEDDRQAAYQEIENLKSQMAVAVENAKQEAQQSAEIIKQFVAEEARKQKRAAKEQARREAERARHAEAMQVQAQAEIERLKADADAARKEFEERARLAALNAREEAEREAKRVREAAQREAQLAREEARLREEASRQQAEAEIERMRDELAKSRAEAEAARVHAELQIEQVRERARQESKDQEAKARKAVEQAQIENEQALVAKQAEINSAIAAAEDSLRRAQEAERSRDTALSEIEKLRIEASTTQQELQNQLSEDIARSEIEHEVAKARAIELANKQSEIEEITRLADEQSNRAKIAENAQAIAESEINRLKGEIQRLREQAEPAADADAEEKAAWQRQHDADIERKQSEIQVAMRQASQEAERAKLSEQAFNQAEDEIKRLKAEMEIATRQAQAQLEADARRAIQQQEEMERKAQVLAQKQAEIALAVERVEKEKQRAEDAERARREAEAALEQLKETAAANRKVMQELKRIRADAKDKDVAMRAADKRAAREAARAEKADRARKAAEIEIKRLKQLAIAQHRKAEMAIKESLQTPSTPKQPARPPVPRQSKEQNSAWISDQVMWETTLGIRQEAPQPAAEEVDFLDEFKEVLLTDIPLVPNQGAANAISGKGKQQSKKPVQQAQDDYDPFLDDPIVYRNSVERSAFQARDISRSVAPQPDAIAFVRRRRALMKKITGAVVGVVVILLGALAYQFSGSGKPSKQAKPAAVQSAPEVRESATQKVESIQERLMKKRRERAKKYRQERKPAKPARSSRSSVDSSRSKTASRSTSQISIPQTRQAAIIKPTRSADDFNSVSISASEPERPRTQRGFSTPKSSRPVVTLRPQPRALPLPAESTSDDASIPALVAPSP